MADFSLITEHPNSKDILSKLLSGTSPKDVAQWLKIKYSKKEQAHLRLSQKLLKDFNDSQYTNVYDQFKKDLTQMSKADKDNKVVSASLLNNKTYRSRLQEIADKEFNILKVLDGLIMVTHDRFEQVFDKIQEDPESFGGDNTLLKYINTIFDVAKKLEEIRIGSPESVMQQNITQQALEEYMAIYQDAIRETLAEIDNDMAMLFMDKLYNKLNNLKAPVPTTQDQRMKEATVLNERIIDIADDIEY
jgi:hypothetical protein